MTFFRLLLLLFACWVAVAHRQFSGLYGPSLLTRSRDRPTGGLPMSSRKFANDSIHRSQTVIPRPP